jgi:hypothetical protein
MEDFVTKVCEGNEIEREDVLNAMNHIEKTLNEFTDKKIITNYDDDGLVNYYSEYYSDESKGPIDINIYYQDNDYLMINFSYVYGCNFDSFITINSRCLRLEYAINAFSQEEIMSELKSVLERLTKNLSILVSIEEADVSRIESLYYNRV